MTAETVKATDNNNNVTTQSTLSRIILHQYGRSTITAVQAYHSSNISALRQRVKRES